LLEGVLVGGTEENAAGGVVAGASDDVVAATAFDVVAAAVEVAEGLALQADRVLVLFVYGAPEVWGERPPEEEAVILAAGAEDIWLAVEEVTTAVWLMLIALL
jgi:hypothetical protein